LPATTSENREQRCRARDLPHEPSLGCWPNRGKLFFCHHPPHIQNDAAARRAAGGAGEGNCDMVRDCRRSQHRADRNRVGDANRNAFVIRGNERTAFDKLSATEKFSTAHGGGGVGLMAAWLPARFWMLDRQTKQTSEVYAFSERADNFTSAPTSDGSKVAIVHGASTLRRRRCQ
jgi:hypothetical protein